MVKLLNNLPVISLIACVLVVFQVGSWMYFFIATQPLARDLVVSTVVVVLAVLAGFSAYQNLQEERKTRPTK